MSGALHPCLSAGATESASASTINSATPYPLVGLTDSALPQALLKYIAPKSTKNDSEDDDMQRWLDSLPEGDDDPNERFLKIQNMNVSDEPKQEDLEVRLRRKPESLLVTHDLEQGDVDAPETESPLVTHDPKQDENDMHTWPNVDDWMAETLKKVGGADALNQQAMEFVTSNFKNANNRIIEAILFQLRQSFTDSEPSQPKTEPSKPKLIWKRLGQFLSSESKKPAAAEAPSTSEADMLRMSLIKWFGMKLFDHKTQFELQKLL